ncbi:MAG TPA: tRNA (guanosine(37)-N1)-methyltransferase TrmD [Lachnospiraceae bacterium]|nr:tRNA (guanosine(37)-N1)-methyltransferase TrmD [Lachnospiraceae bacterium]
MIFHVLTLFPEMVIQGLSPSVIGRAWEKKVISLDAVDIRDYTTDRHRKVDDYPYGGGAGMLMQAQPVYDAHRAVTGGKKIRTIYVTPQGTPFTQAKAQELAAEDELVFLCGHYEGIDERVLEEIVTDYISIGDYVLTGGELPAMVMIDAIARLIPGVLGNDFSAEEESFYNDLLEYPQYSRPEEWHGKKVPQVLLSGNHQKVTQWRLEQARQRTAERRPDLYEKYQEKQLLIRKLARHKRNNIHLVESLTRGCAEVLYSDIMLAGHSAEEHTAAEIYSAEGKRIAAESVLLYDRSCKTCMALAADMASGEAIAERLPADTELIIVSEPYLKELLKQRGYKVLGSYIQVLYTRKEALPVKHREICRLTMEHYPYVCRWYCNDGKCGPGIDDAYVRERIQAGAMYGAFIEGSQVGFVGIHSEGSLGMLFVEESFRGQGIASSLEAYAVNRMLEKGWTPYGHISAGNTASVKLQEKLGFYRAEKNYWWLEKTLANSTLIC